MMHSTELREIRSMIRDELDFRAEVGKEINKQQEQNWEDEADVRPIYSDGQMKFELHGPGPDEEK